MKVRQIVPEANEVAVTHVLEAVDHEQPQLGPFHPSIVEFCSAFSQRLFRDPAAQQFPELTALAFWLRRAELKRLEEAFTGLGTDDTIVVPSGLVFHIPPANVDTIFVYSWVLSLLLGNRNVVRISSRESEQVAILCRILNELCHDPVGQDVMRSTVMISYGHESDITGMLSAACDLRVIWGGDASVEHIRAIPIPPMAREIAFPNRYSLAAMNARSVLALSAEERLKVAGQFYNDLFWFDQMGCSSPRLLVWIGRDPECRDAASALLDTLLEVVEAKEYRLSLGVVMQKLAFAYGAIMTRPVATLQTYRNEITILQLETLDNFSIEHSGGGLLFQAHVERLQDIASVVDRRFQTLSYFGIEASELEEFGRLLNGRGIDRMVPVGQALTFHRFWDGYDLLQALSRRVHIVGS
jgi:hypothetical protein